MSIILNEMKKGKAIMGFVVCKVMNDLGTIDTDVYHIDCEMDSNDFIYNSEFDERDGIKICQIIVSAFFIEQRVIDNVYDENICEITSIKTDKLKSLDEYVSLSQSIDW